MKSFIINVDDIRERDDSIGLPIGVRGKHPIKDHKWLPTDKCIIKDYGRYYAVSTEESLIYPELAEGDDVVTYVPRY